MHFHGFQLPGVECLILINVDSSCFMALLMKRRVEIMDTGKLNTQSTPGLAAIHCHSSQATEALLDQVVQTLKGGGMRISGLLQRHIAEEGCGLQLESILDGSLHRVTQNLGSGSVSCNVDTNAMDQLSMQLLAELERGVDLLVLNRFGKRESTGGGFCNVIEKAVEFNIPLLTVVKDSWLSSWTAYGGEFVVVLPEHRGDILAWCRSAVKPVVQLDSISL
jgi:nucleoside-triphosphatase THEP1